MNEIRIVRIDRQPAPEEQPLAAVVALFPTLPAHRIVGVARIMVQGAGDITWPPPVPQPDDDDGPTAA
jgi:hypothetical protein